MFYSVIVPVFNSGDYLRKCVDSILGQSFEDYELLLVDDASTDGSRQVCEEYCRNNDCCHLIARAENGGSSAARNDGLSHAKGEYALFIDNDDWFEGSDFFKNLHEHLILEGKPDIMAFSLGEFYPRAKKMIAPKTNHFSHICATENHFERVDYLLRNGLYISSACAKVVRMDLIKKNRVTFDTSITSNEDSDWSGRLLYYANSISWFDETHYIYRRSSDVSQSSKPISLKTINDVSAIIQKHVEKVNSGEIDERKINCASSFFSYIYVILMSYLFMLPRKETHDFRVAQKRNAWLLNYGKNDRVALTKRSTKIIGYTLTGKLLATIMNRERLRVSKS